MDPLRTQRGAALILVIWTFAVLTALAGEFARAMRQEAQSTSNFKQETIAHYAAIGALNEVMFVIVTFDDKFTPTPDDGAGLGAADDEEISSREAAIAALLRGNGEWITDNSFAGVPYEVRVQEEVGLVNLNGASQPLLVRIIENLGYDEQLAEIVADSIIDWRDEDGDHGLNGAEDNYYEKLDRPYQSKDGSFSGTEELLLVRGVSRAMFYGTDDTPGLRDIFYAGTPRRRVQVAEMSMSDAVRHALCGVTPDDEADSDDYFGAKDSDTDISITECLQELAGLGELGTTKGGGEEDLWAATVEVRVKDENDRVLTHIGTTVNFKDDPRALRWSDSIFTEGG